MSETSITAKTITSTPICRLPITSTKIVNLSKGGTVNIHGRNKSATWVNVSFTSSDKKSYNGWANVANLSTLLRNNATILAKNIPISDYPGLNKKDIQKISKARGKERGGFENFMRILLVLGFYLSLWGGLMLLVFGFFGDELPKDAPTIVGAVFGVSLVGLFSLKMSSSVDQEIEHLKKLAEAKMTSGEKSARNARNKAIAGGVALGIAALLVNKATKPKSTSRAKTKTTPAKIPANPVANIERRNALARQQQEAERQRKNAQFKKEQERKVAAHRAQQAKKKANQSRPAPTNKANERWNRQASAMWEQERNGD